MLLTLFPSTENNDWICLSCKHSEEKENQNTGIIEQHCKLFAKHYPNQNFDQLTVCIQSCTHAKLY